MIKEFDSTLIQFMSVKNFAETLGFEYKEDQHSFCKFYNGKWKYYSFLDLQELHNHYLDLFYMGDFNPKFKLSWKQVKQAVKTKLVETTALCYNKEMKTFTSQKTWVKFVH